jgi:hypothetical protein
MQSGSCWSPFFCRECQLLAMGVSVWTRSLVFPIGRHSFMHTWVPENVSPTLAAHGGQVHALAQTVSGALQGIRAGSDRLHQWYRTIMARNLEVLGLAGGVPLRDYLAAIARARIGCLSTRLVAFEGLCEFVKTALSQPQPAQSRVGSGRRQSGHGRSSVTRITGKVRRRRQR